jgi:membrane-associated phospholipid phosphatase
MTALSRAALVFALVACASALPQEASAQGPEGTATAQARPSDPQHYPVLAEVEPTIHWHYPRFDEREFAITGAALAVSIGAAVAPVPAWRWSGATGVDDAVRSAIRLGHYRARRAAADTSDVLLATTMTFPILFDALVTAWSRRGSGAVARQLMLIDLETMAVAGAVTALTSSLVGRERPFAAGGFCETEEGRNQRDCDPDLRFRYRSFFSGHTSMSFTAAALVCTHHAHLRLYRNAGDTAVCIAAMGAAAATGTLRMMSDVHYVTDVMAGAAVGTLIGFGVPWLLHYREPPPLRTGATGPSFSVVPNPTGVSLVGLF